MLTPGAVCSTRLCCFCALCSVFVRGSSVLSTDSSASPFWDKYLEFELAQFSTPAAQEQLQLLPPPYTGTLIGGLYALVTSLPLKDVDRFWASFTQRFAAHYPLNYLASPEEAAQLTSEYPSSVPTGPDGAPLAASLTDYVNAWEAEQRAALLSKREYAFRVAVQLRDEKAMYEAAISRPYFHTAPLSPPELSNWTNYLDFWEGKLMRSFAASHATAAAADSDVDLSIDVLDPLLLADVLKLHERCLIPAARYAEPWERYATFLEGMGETMRAYEVRQRALFFLEKNTLPGAAPTVPSMPPAQAQAQALAAVQEQYTALALLEEKQGEVAKARDLLAKAIAIPPAAAAAVPSAGPSATAADPATPVLEAHLALIHLERRAWQAAHPAEALLPLDCPVVELFESALRVLEPASSLSHTRGATFLSLQFASFLWSSVAFPSLEERVKRVREVFTRAAEWMFPKPAAAAAAEESPAADGAAPPAPAAAPTVPRLPVTKQFDEFWAAYLAFEERQARAPLEQLVAVYERALRQSPVAAGLPSGASGLSETARRNLWSGYMSLVEDRAPTLEQVARVQKAAKAALLALAPSTPPSALQSALGKRKAAASDTPIAQPHAQKMQRVGPPPPPQARPYGGGYGGGGGYGHHGGGGGYGGHHGGYGGGAGGYGYAQPPQQQGYYQ